MAEERTGSDRSYAGEVTPLEAWTLLKDDASAQLVDVRTPPEWTFAGVPDIASFRKRPVMLSWKLFPSFEVNTRFIDELERNVPAKEAPLLFICRTGGRSLDAARAAVESGYKHCFNVTDGFEGPLNNNNHRGEISGWKADALPWEQG
ncbi:MAG: rhodanese-like domain-containing protein [Alphaproteobacteria bacterium]|nr:rhodanese-like domain-containing protein [Alphaproteobacteria bacterium]